MRIDAKDKYFLVNRSLPISKEVQLLLFLVCNIYIFSSSSYEALEIDLEFICHRLNVDLYCIPKKQKLRRSLDIHSKAVNEVVDKLKEVGAIKEVFYPK